jgi:TolA-binding protein
MLNKKSAEGQRQQQLRQMEEKIELMRSFSSSQSGDMSEYKKLALDISDSASRIVDELESDKF